MKIDEFEFRNKQGQEIEPTKNQLVIYIKSLHKEIKELKKALELACDYLVSNGNEDDELYKLVQNIYADDEYLATKINYFKTKAKEMLESE